MSDLTDRAIARITEECQEKDHLIPFEEYLTSIMTDKIAEKVLDEKKSLQGCFDEMKETGGKAHGPKRKRRHRVHPAGRGVRPSSGTITASTSQKNPGPAPGVIDIMDFL